MIPALSNGAYAHIAFEICNKLNDMKVQNVIIMGDFNRQPAEMNCFLEPLNAFNLRQLITGATHDFGRTIDHIYSNLPDSKLISGSIDSLTNTDHRPIFISIKKE